MSCVYIVYNIVCVNFQRINAVENELSLMIWEIMAHMSLILHSLSSSLLALSPALSRTSRVLPATAAH